VLAKEPSLLIAMGKALARQGEDSRGSVYSRSKTPEGLVSKGR